jgi:hypothetical protein
VFAQPHTAGPAQWSRRKAPRASEALALPSLGRRGRQRSRRRGSALVSGSAPAVRPWSLGFFTPLGSGALARALAGCSKIMRPQAGDYFQQVGRGGTTDGGRGRPRSPGPGIGVERATGAPAPRSLGARPSPGPKGRHPTARSEGPGSSRKTNRGLKVRDRGQRFFCDWRYILSF